MAQIHISEAKAAKDFRGLLARVRAGAEVIIDSEIDPAVVLRVANVPATTRLLSESLRMARKLGAEVTLDDGFGKDLEALVNEHSEASNNPWD
jgi:hypothetical protein